MVQVPCLILFWLLGGYFASGLMSKVFVNGPGDRGSIPARAIPMPQKWYLMPPCLTLNIIR